MSNKLALITGTVAARLIDETAAQECGCESSARKGVTPVDQLCGVRNRIDWEMTSIARRGVPAELLFAQTAPPEQCTLEHARDVQRCSRATNSDADATAGNTT